MNVLYLIKYKYSHLSFVIKNLKAIEVLRNLNTALLSKITYFLGF